MLIQRLEVYEIIIYICDVILFDYIKWFRGVFDM